MEILDKVGGGTTFAKRKINWHKTLLLKGSFAELCKRFLARSSKVESVRVCLYAENSQLSDRTRGTLTAPTDYKEMGKSQAKTVAAETMFILAICLCFPR